MGVKKKRKPTARGPRATVELVQVTQRRSKRSRSVDADVLTTIEESVPIPPELQSVARFLENCVNEFARHRESLAEDGARRLMENLYPEIQTIEGYSKMLETVMDHRRTTGLMSLSEEADTLAKSFLRQMEFERGFLAAVNRYEADLVNSTRYQEDQKAHEKRQSIATQNKREVDRRNMSQREQLVYEEFIRRQRQGKATTVKAIAQKLSYSGNTVRKYLKLLEESGRLVLHPKSSS